MIMFKRCALTIAVLSMGAMVSVTGAVAQTYVAPGGSPVATAPGGPEGYGAPLPASRYDGLTTGSVGIDRPAAYDAAGRPRAGERHTDAWTR